MKNLLPLFLLFFVIGCATRGFPPVNGINNFDRVNNNLYRGGQPDNLGIQNLKNLGIKTVINLRMANDVWVAEESLCMANEIIYINVPMNGLLRPTNEQVYKVLLIIDTFPSPVFIHCEHGCDRTGTIVACYRIKRDHWTSKQALSEAKQYGMSILEFGMKDYIEDFEKNCNEK